MSYFLEVVARIASLFTDDEQINVKRHVKPVNTQGKIKIFARQFAIHCSATF